MKRMIALIMGVILLTGCTVGGVRLTPNLGGSTQPQATQEPAQRTVTVYDPNGVLTQALDTYAQQQQVEIVAAQQQDAALLVSYQMPTKEFAKNLSENGGLLPIAAGMSNDTACYGLPFGANSYGYLVDARAMKALLGEKFDAKYLKGCSWSEWKNFVETLNSWMEKPQKKTVKLAGKSYTLPAKKPQQLENLAAVFTFAGENAYSGPILSPVLATHYKTVDEVKEMTQQDTEALKGALARLAQVIGLETNSVASPEGRLEKPQALELTAEQARQAFVEGRALFYRTSATESVLMDEALQQNLFLMPIKYGFEADDLQGGYSLQELESQPVTVAGGWFVVCGSATPQQQKEAEAFLLWMYTNENGKTMLPPTDTTVQGLPDLSTGLQQATKENVQQQAHQLAENG